MSLPRRGRKKRRGRPRSKSAPAAISLNVKKRKQWTDEAMQAAVDAVREGHMPVLRASHLYNIPKTTLYDRISGKVLHGSKLGPKPYFSPTEEREMASFLVDVAKAGYGKTRKEVRHIVGMAAHDKGRIINSQVSHGWFKRFLERQPQLSYRRGDPTANVRIDCLNKDAMTQYFDLLKEVLTENNLMNSPGM